MKTNLKQTIIATLIILGMAGIVGAVVTTSADFPHRLSSFQDNDIIQSGDWGNIEAEIGTRIGNVATGTPQTLNWIIRNGSFATTSIKIGTTATTTISGDNGGSTLGTTTVIGYFNTGILTATSSITTNNLTVNGTCTGCVGATINSGTINRFAYYSGATTIDSLNGFQINAANGSTTFPTLNVGILTATSGTSFLNALTLGTKLPNSELANSTISGVALGSNLANLTATNGTLIFSATYNGSAAATIGLNLNNQNTWTASSTFPVVNTGAITATSTATFYNATTSSLAITSSLIANVATSTITNLAVTTLTSNQYPTFTIASTTLMTNGSTTILLGTTFVAETWNQAICRTDTSTADLIFYNSTQQMNVGTGITTIHASTASSSVTFTAQNALPANENRKVDIGNVGATMNYLTCTIDKTINK